jgi:hypothetical protein
MEWCKVGTIGLESSGPVWHAPRRNSAPRVARPPPAEDRDSIKTGRVDGSLLAEPDNLSSEH